MLHEKESLSHIINLSNEIASVKDIDMLLEKVLTIARQFVNADAGSIYIKEDNRLRFNYTQNETMQKKLPSGQKLIYSTFSIPINSESIAGYAAGCGEMLNIPDVYFLPYDVPYFFNKEYDEITKYRTKSMLTCPLKNYRDEVIGVLQLINAKDSNDDIIPFSRENEPYVMHFANSAAAAIERAQMTRAIILRMIKMAELRDPKETGAHVNRVASYSVEIYEKWAQQRSISITEIDKNKDILRMAAMLHDVGKVAISDTILKKPAKLDPDEYEIMKQHTFLGSRLFTDKYSEFDDASAIVSLNHHERWDGNGYPGYVNPLTGLPIVGYGSNKGAAVGKKGAEIPLLGRIVAIADVYDALCSKRVYKESWDEGRVLETLKSESGKQFDPEIVDAFFSSLNMIKAIAHRYPE